MATRAISLMMKSSFFNVLSRPSFSIKHGQSSSALGSLGSTLSSTPPSVGSALRKEMFSFSSLTDRSQLFPAAGLVQRNLSCCPAFRSVITHPKNGSSMVSTLVSQSSCYSTSMKYANVDLRFAKQRRNRGELKGTSDNKICIGNYGLQVLEPAWITSKQILAGQLAMKRNMRGGKLVLRIFPHKPISLRPAETRMGRGKGNVAYWVAGVRAGRILYEISGVPETVARKAITVAASKFPVRTRFVKS